MRIINATLASSNSSCCMREAQFQMVKIFIESMMTKSRVFVPSIELLEYQTATFGLTGPFPTIWADLLARTRGWKPEGGLHSDLRVKLFLSPFRATWVKTGADTRTVVVGTKMIGISMVDGLRHPEETSGLWVDRGLGFQMWMCRQNHGSRGARRVISEQQESWKQKIARRSLR